MSTNIEERLAHLERLADDLNDVVASQAKEIDRLTKRVQMLMEREAARESEGGGGVVIGGGHGHYTGGVVRTRTKVKSRKRVHRKKRHKRMKRRKRRY